MIKNRYDDEFVIYEAMFLIETKATYKQLADHFHMPVSTAGWHIKYRIKRISPVLHTQAMAIVKSRKRKFNNMGV